MRRCWASSSTAIARCWTRRCASCSELFSTLRALVVGVRREGTLFAPEPGDQLFAGDQIYVFTHTDDTGRTLEIFGKTAKRPRTGCLIVGGGNVGPDRRARAGKRARPGPHPRDRTGAPPRRAGRRWAGADHRAAR